MASTHLFLEAGRVQDARLSGCSGGAVSRAERIDCGALVNYRLAELSLQRDMGVLEVNETGLWREYTPEVERD